MATSKGSEGWAWIRAEAARIDNPEACSIWPFMGSDDYGRVWDPSTRKRVRVHRAVWLESGRDIPEGAVIRHLCGNGPAGCATLGHLATGTQSDNYRDSVGHQTASLGERHASAVLTEGQAREIIRRRSEGTPVTELAREFEVSKQQVSRIAKGLRWSHLQPRKGW